MASGWLLATAGRAATVDERALVAALRAGQLGAAALLEHNLRAILSGTALRNTVV